MKFFKRIYLFIESFWQYLGQSQDKKFRLLHIGIAILIIIQILDSDFVEIGYGLNWGAYIHISGGILIAVLSVFLIFAAFEKRGIRYYYPYLFNNFSVIKSDLLEILKFRLPNARSGSIAAVVQGLGLLALVIAWFSGCSWFVAWNFKSSYSNNIKEWHTFLVGLIEIYIYAHGLMGILHYIADRYFPKFISDIKG
jgi:cytochrome b561